MPEKNSVVLTDYPKQGRIKACYRGMETDDLVRRGDQMTHIMMDCWGDGPICGWYIDYTIEGILAELEWRKDFRLHDKWHFERKEK